VPEYQQFSILRQVRAGHQDGQAGDSAGQPLNRVFERHRSGGWPKATPPRSCNMAPRTGRQTGRVRRHYRLGGQLRRHGGVRTRGDPGKRASPRSDRDRPQPVRATSVLARNNLLSVHLHHAERTFSCCACSTITEGNRRVAALLPATGPGHTVGGVGRASDDDQHGLVGGGAVMPPTADARGSGAGPPSNSGRAPGFRVRSPRVR
jgi:hypothetical protein